MVGFKRVKDKSLRQELLDEKSDVSPEREKNWPRDAPSEPTRLRESSSVRVFVPTEARYVRVRQMHDIDIIF